MLHENIPNLTNNSSSNEKEEISVLEGKIDILLEEFTTSGLRAEWAAE